MTKNAKRILVLLASAGIIAVVVGGSTGTFASFNAEVANSGNTFQTGTLFLHDTASGNTCTSESAANNSNTTLNGDTCSAIFNVGGTTANGAASLTYYQLSLKNAGTAPASFVRFDANSACASVTAAVANGSIDTGGVTASTTIPVAAGTLTVEMPAGSIVKFGSSNTVFHTVGATAPGATTFTVDNPVTASAAAAINYYPATFTATGDGDLCAKVGLSIYDVTAETNPASVTTPGGSSVCVYVPGCDYVSANTLLNGLPASLGVTNATLKNAGTPITLSAGQTRYFLIGINKPDLDNSYQSKVATMSLLWHIDE